MTKLNEYQKLIITSGLVSWARELKVEMDKHGSRR
jgi:hypothetical protein